MCWYKSPEELWEIAWEASCKWLWDVCGALLYAELHWTAGDNFTTKYLQIPGWLCPLRLAIWSSCARTRIKAFLEQNGPPELWCVPVILCYSLILTSGCSSDLPPALSLPSDFLCCPEFRFVPQHLGFWFSYGWQLWLLSSPKTLSGGWHQCQIYV